MRTELGAIATMLQAVQRDSTPLQRRPDQLGRRLPLMALHVFDTLPLSIGDLALAALLASVVFAVVEIEKWLGRRSRRILISDASSTPV